MKIDFERETSFGTFRDAITLPDDHGFSEAEIQAMMQQRVDNFLAFIENARLQEPQPEPEYIEVDGVKYQKVQ